MSLDVRRMVLEACLHLAGQGYLAGTAGNLALRDGAGRFVVTPSGRDYYTLVPEDLCVLRLDTLEQLAGPHRPSVEAGLHAQVFRARPDVVASVHTHQPLASAAALLGLPVPVPLEEDRERLGPELVPVPYAPSGTGFLVRALGARLRPGANAYLLKNHGLVCAGRNLGEAVEAAARVERICAAFLRSAIQATGDASEPARFALSNLP